MRPSVPAWAGAAKLMVIRLVSQNLVRTVELLQQYNAREHVRKRHWSERQLVVRPLDSSIPNAPPITKQTSTPPWRRSSSQSANASEVYERPRESSTQTYARSGIRRSARLLVGDLDHIDAGVAREQLRVVGEIVGIRRLGLPDRDHEVAHGVGC